MLDTFTGVTDAISNNVELNAITWTFIFYFVHSAFTINTIFRDELVTEAKRQATHIVSFIHAIIASLTSIFVLLEMMAAGTWLSLFPSKSFLILGPISIGYFIHDLIQMYISYNEKPSLNIYSQDSIHVPQIGPMTYDVPDNLKGQLFDRIPGIQNEKNTALVGVPFNQQILIQNQLQVLEQRLIDEKIKEQKDIKVFAIYHVFFLLCLYLILISRVAHGLAAIIMLSELSTVVMNVHQYFWFYAKYYNGHHIYYRFGWQQSDWVNLALKYNVYAYQSFIAFTATFGIFRLVTVILATIQFFDLLIYESKWPIIVALLSILVLNVAWFCLICTRLVSYQFVKPYYTQLGRSVRRCVSFY